MNEPLVILYSLFMSHPIIHKLIIKYNVMTKEPNNLFYKKYNHSLLSQLYF